MKYAALVFFLSVSLPAQAQDYRIKEGMPFAKARSILLAHAWRPIAVDIESERIGVENQLVKKQIIEIESCAIDQPLCIFNYKKGAACLRVMTRGEKVKDLVIDSWSNDCPN